MHTISTYKALAEYLGVSVSTARRNAEQIPCFFVGGKRLWAKEVIDKWAKQGGCPKEKEEQK